MKDQSSWVSLASEEQKAKWRDVMDRADVMIPQEHYMRDYNVFSIARRLLVKFDDAATLEEVKRTVETFIAEIKGLRAEVEEVKEYKLDLEGELNEAMQEAVLRRLKRREAEAKRKGEKAL
jgi:predicted RNase H-like nuclease (RuvC/YqgF family)